MYLRSLILVVASLTCIAASAVGQTRPVTLEWDASPERSLAGYIVYVGNGSGSYDEQYDVGQQTSFTYSRAVPGRLYYFAVAAYAPGPNIGPPSEEILFLSGTATTTSSWPLALHEDPPTPRRDNASGAAVSAARATVESRTLCVARHECYGVELLALVAGDVRALVPTGDGRLFFIEDGKHIRIVQDDLLVPQPALSVEPAVGQMTALVLDPAFANSRFAYVGIVESRPGRSRQLNIVRYREVANALGEGATVIAGLPLPTVGDASFAIDSAGRLYVAMPMAPVGDTGASRYAGMVLRFESDGTAVREDGAAAPVFSPGYARPTSVAWTGGNDLWLAGTGADWAGTLARLSLDRSTVGALTAPESIGLATDAAVVGLSALETTTARARATGDRAALVLVDEVGAVFQIVAASGGMTANAWIEPNALGGRVVSAVRSPGSTNADDIYVAVVGGDEAATMSSQIVRLRRR